MSATLFPRLKDGVDNGLLSPLLSIGRHNYLQLTCMASGADRMQHFLIATTSPWKRSFHANNRCLPRNDFAVDSLTPRQRLKMGPAFPVKEELLSLLH